MKVRHPQLNTQAAPKAIPQSLEKKRKQLAELAETLPIEEIKELLRLYHQMHTKK